MTDCDRKLTGSATSPKGTHSFLACRAQTLRSPDAPGWGFDQMAFQVSGLAFLDLPRNLLSHASVPRVPGKPSAMLQFPLTPFAGSGSISPPGLHFMFHIATTAHLPPSVLLSDPWPPNPISSLASLQGKKSSTPKPPSQSSETNSSSRLERPL